ncbi:type III-A CRISPR-associated protein Csm2 [Patescibacteria group bacterium]|nr:type III-A CRISPR-associated protein Csm2 [Patescibacteria group bacterium]
MALFDSDEDLVNEAKQIAERLRNVKTHQLRRIYSQVYSIYQQSKGDFAPAKSRLVLLKPQLAYAESRKPQLHRLTSKLIALIDQVDQGGDPKENLKKIYQFVQSVVGYHKERRE